MDQQATNKSAAFTVFATAEDVTATAARAAAAAIRPAADGRWCGRQLLLLLLLVPQAAIALPNKQKHFINIIEPGGITATGAAAPAESAAATAAEPAGATAAVEQKQHEVSYATEKLPVHSHIFFHEHLPAKISAAPQAGGEAQEETAEEQEKSSKAVALSSDKSVSAVETISKDPFDTPPGRVYICRYGRAGLACGSRRGNDYPAGTHCMEHECCSKTKCVNFQCGSFCSTSWALCSSRAIYFDAYSYGKCTCGNKGSECPPHSNCHQELREFGGVYCTCKDGYLMSNSKCIENPCTRVNCSPGKCSLEGLTPHCNCPKGYLNDGNGVNSTCKMKNICESNPCGNSHEALDCSPLIPEDYTCTCATGYVVSKASGKPKCVTYESTLKCTDLPCGTEGLDKCEDTDKGFKCTCKSGYRLVESKFARKCEFVNPCESNICGPPAAVLSCSASGYSYTCQCRTGYALFTGSNSQFCQIDESTGQYNTYVLAGLGVGAVVVSGLCYVAWSNNKKIVRGDSLGEAYEENPNAQNAGGMMNPTGNMNQTPGGVPVAPSGWA